MLLPWSPATDIGPVDKRGWDTAQTSTWSQSPVILTAREQPQVSSIVRPFRLLATRPPTPFRASPLRSRQPETRGSYPTLLLSRVLLGACLPATARTASLQAMVNTSRTTRQYVAASLHLRLRWMWLLRPWLLDTLARTTTPQLGDPRATTAAALLMRTDQHHQEAARPSLETRTAALPPRARQLTSLDTHTAGPARRTHRASGEAHLALG